MTAIKDHHITKIACGSSHSIVFASNILATAVEFTPISFPTPNDPLGTTLTSSKLIEDNHLPEIKRPSLTRIILSLKTPLKQQEALAHVQTSLQIAYARDAIVNSLGGVASAAQESTGEDKDGDDGGLADMSVSSQDMVPATSDRCSPDLSGEIVTRKKLVHIPSGLDDFTSMLTVEDARVLVDLLKLAVANRVGEKGKETLGAVLTAMGKANPKVCIYIQSVYVGIYHTTEIILGIF